MEESSDRLKILQAQEKLEKMRLDAGLDKNGNSDEFEQKKLAEYDFGKVIPIHWKTDPIDPEAVNAAECAEMLVKAKIWANEKSGMPLAVVEKITREGALQNRQQIFSAIEGVRAGQKLIGFSGASGSGKTTSACFLLWNKKIRNDRYLSEHRFNLTEPVGKFVWTPTLVRTPEYKLEEHWIWKEPFAVIDDIARENERKKDLVADVLLHRFENGFKTVFTTHLDLKGLKDRYGEMIVDRIRRGGSVFDLKKEDFRRRKTDDRR